MKKKIKNLDLAHRKGFTLIELLVVIAIIGILSSFSVVSLNSARIRARDAKRKADTIQVRTAINLYYEDYDAYPICGSWDGGADDFGATTGCYTGTLATALTAGERPYMNELPADPLNSGVYVYRYVSNGLGNEAALVYETEDSSDSSPQVLRIW